jgi:hypothetical protein
MAGETGEEILPRRMGAAVGDGGRSGGVRIRSGERLPHLPFLGYRWTGRLGTLGFHAAGPGRVKDDRGRLLFHDLTSM